MIIGGGFLGKQLAQRIVNTPCYLTSRQPRVSATGHQNLVLDVNQISTFSVLEPLAEQEWIDVFYLVPPSAVQPESLQALIETLKSLPLRRAIMTSSTVVYGNRARTVDADSKPEPDSERALRQYRLEGIWTSFGDQATIVRLAGLYGPGRIIGEGMIKQQRPIPSNPDAWLNLIHVADAATLLTTVADSERAASIELGCDDEPVLRRDYYHHVATLFSAPEPLFQSQGQWSGADRRCDNQATSDRLSWKPKFSNYRQGLEHCLTHRHS